MINSEIYRYYQEGQIQNGRKVFLAGGYGDYIYYQVLYNSVGDPPPSVATFEATGESVIFRYNIFTEEITRVSELEKIALHINASKNYVIVSEYDYDVPLSESGKIISLDKNCADYVIPDVESGTDIINSRFLNENTAVFYTPKMLYFADFMEEVLFMYEIKEDESVVLGLDRAYLINSHDERADIYYTLYEDVLKSR